MIGEGPRRGQKDGSGQKRASAQIPPGSFPYSVAMKMIHGVALSLSLGFLIACAPGPEGSPAAAAKAPATPRPVFEVKAGTELPVIMDFALSSKTAQPGDRVEAHLAHDLVVDAKVLARAGSAVRGKVTAAVPSGRVKTRARLAFAFDSIVVEGGAAQSVATRAIDITAEDTHKRDALTIGGGAGAGALIGALTDGGKGAGVGALIGAGAGTGVVLIDKGKNIHIPAGGTLSIQLTQALKVTP